MNKKRIVGLLLVGMFVFSAFSMFAENTNAAAIGVTITSPTEGQTFTSDTGKINVTGNYSGAVTNIQICRVGGAWVNVTLVPANSTWYLYGFNISILPIGDTVISSKATDGTNITYYNVTIHVVSAGNSIPTVSISSPTSGSTVNGTISITGTASDTDGTVQSVKVKIDDGAWQTATGTTSWSYSWDTTGVTNGAHTIYAQSIDNGSAGSDIASVTVTVDNPTPVAPTASFTYSASGLTVTFTDASTDSDGSIMNWTWDFGDGDTSYLQNPTHTYASGGTYTAALTVKDNSGLTDSYQKSITVSIPSATEQQFSAITDMLMELLPIIVVISIFGAIVSYVGKLKFQ